MTDDRLRQAALDLIHKIQATGEAQDVEEADSFIVGAFDPETSRTSYIGSFPARSRRWSSPRVGLPN